MEIIPVSEAEVKTILMSLKPKNSTGKDGIPNKIVKHCAHFISKSLTYIYNCSLTTGIHSFSFRGSVQDYKIHMDMEVVKLA